MENVYGYKMFFRILTDLTGPAYSTSELKEELKDVLSYKDLLYLVGKYAKKDLWASHQAGCPKYKGIKEDAGEDFSDLMDEMKDAEGELSYPYNY